MVRKRLRDAWRYGGATAVTLVSVLGALCIPACAQDQSLDKPTYRFLSGPGTVALVGYGVFRGVLTEGHHTGRTEALRTTDALIVSVAVSEGLKQIIYERRPDRSAKDSFPSGHAAAAFAVATMEAHYHPNEAPLWYLGATLIGDSRIRLHKHYFHDVFAGGVLGVLIAEVEWHQPRGLLIAPIYRAENGTHGVTLGTRF